MQYDFTQRVLRTDASGMPLDWISYKQAASAYYLDQVLYSCGTPLFTVRGGINAISGKTSCIEISSIIATKGQLHHQYQNSLSYTPPLNNKALFARDAHLCLYCGGRFSHGELSRDHVRPLMQNGQNNWNNVVTACKRCNNFKAGRTPEQAGMQLLAVPFTPTHAEYVYLRGRKVLADQITFLKAHFPRKSPLHQRLEQSVLT